jgi:hypothetical protein
MKRLTIMKLTFKGNYCDIEGIDIIAMTQKEYDRLKSVIDANGYKELPT